MRHGIDASGVKADGIAITAARRKATHTRIVETKACQSRFWVVAMVHIALTTLLGVARALNVSVGDLLDLPDVIIVRDSVLGRAVEQLQTRVFRCFKRSHDSLV